MAGVWSNVLVQYDDSIRYGKRTFPFVISRLEPVQVGNVDFGGFRWGLLRSVKDLRNGPCRSPNTGPHERFWSG